MKFINLQQATFAACKLISTSDFRKPINSSINGITFATPDNDDPKNRVMIGYHAREWVNQANQFRNFILVHERNPDFKPPHKMPGWDFSLTPEELNNFTLGHNTLKHLNYKLAEKLYTQLPQFQGLLDVYGQRYDKFVYPHSERLDLGDSLISTMADTFNLSPAIETIYSVNRALTKQIGTGFLEAIISLEERLHKERLASKEVDREWFDARTATMRGDREGELTKALLAFVAARASIKNMNQLLFQSFYIDRLATITEDAIYKFEHGNSNYLCRYGSIGYQMDSAPISQPNEIIQISVNTKNTKFKSLVIPRNYSMSMGGEDGNIVEIEFVKLDQHLNHFYSFTRRTHDG